MSICVYAPNTLDFGNNGLGILTPLECIVEEQCAGIYECKLIHPIDDSYRWMQLQHGYLLKVPVPVRESPIAESEIPNGSTEVIVTRQIYRVTGTSVGVHLRSGAGSGYKSLGVMRNGAKAIELPDQTSDNYMHVCMVDGGAVGYLSKKYLTLDSTVSETVSSSGSSIVMPAQSRQQIFRIMSVETDSEEGFVTATAVHITYDHNGNILADDYNPESDDVANAIAKLNGNLLNASDITIHAPKLTGTVSGEYGYKNPTEVLLDPEIGIVKQTGAMVIRDNFDIWILPEMDRDRGVTIRRGKNLAGVIVETDMSSVVTRIIPVGRDKDGNPLYLDGQKYVDSQRINDYPQIIAQKIEYDVEIGDKYKNASAARAELKKRAEEEYSKNGIDLPKYGMKVDFVMLNEDGSAAYAALQAVHMYDTVTVIDELIGVKAKLRMTAYEWDALAKQYISVTLGNLQELSQTVYGFQLPSQSISGNKIINNSVSGNVLRNATIQYAKIAIGTIEQLNANSITAVTAKIQEIVAGGITTDELYAALAEIVALKVGNLTADDITTDRLAAALAQFTVLTAGTAEFDRATVQHLVAEALNLEFGTAEQVYIRNLAVEYAQMVGAAIGNLCIKASDGNYYNIDVDSSGNVIATATTVSDGEVSAGETEGGKVILETDITAGNLNTSNLLATYALINRIDAARIDVDELFAREAFVAKLITSQIFADGGSLQIIAGQANKIARWFTFDDERGFVVQRKAYTDADGVVHPASIWYTVTDETGYHIHNTRQVAPVGSFQRGGLSTTGVQIGDIVAKRTSSGGWVWTDAT